MSNEKRENILRKIKALREKTTANGCTEAEAMAAMAKMEELMNEHNVAFADISEVEAAQYGIVRANAGIKSDTRVTWHPALSICAWPIIQMCGCEGYRSGSGDYVIFGEKNDALTAQYLIGLIRTTSEQAWRQYWDYNRRFGGHAARERASFLHGFGGRVRDGAIEILKERKAQRDAINASLNQETALILVKKDQLVKSKWQNYKDQNNLRLASINSSLSTNSDRAASAGRVAGGSVSLGGSRNQIGASARRLNS